MPAMNKDLLHQGFNFTIACYDAGIDASPVATWLNEQARLGITTPIAGLPLRTTANGAGSFDQAVLAAVQSSPNGVDMTELGPILKQYGRPNNQIGAALKRLQKKTLIAKKGDLWIAGKVTPIDTGRRQRSRKTTAPKANSAATAGAQPQTATG